MESVGAAGNGRWQAAAAGGSGRRSCCGLDGGDRVVGRWPFTAKRDGDCWYRVRVSATVMPAKGASKSAARRSRLADVSYAGCATAPAGRRLPASCVLPASE